MRVECERFHNHSSIWRVESIEQESGEQGLGA